MSKKLIKVTNRCNVLTSRGYCIGPILYPYYEETPHILNMISKGAIVLEVLEDNTEVVLTNSNFDRDNSIPKEDKKQPNQNPNNQKNNNQKTNQNPFNKNNNNKQFNKNNNQKHNNFNKPNNTYVEPGQPIQKEYIDKPDVIVTAEQVITKKVIEDVVEEA